MILTSMNISMNDDKFSIFSTLETSPITHKIMHAIVKELMQEFLIEASYIILRLLLSIIITRHVRVQNSTTYREYVS